MVAVLIALILSSIILSGIVASFMGFSEEPEFALENQEVSYFYGKEDSKNIIARLELYGDVIDPYQEMTMPAFFGDMDVIDGMVISKQLKELSQEKDIKAVVLDLSTYGGSPAGAALILEAVENYKKETNNPVYTFVADASFSAGAYLSANSDKIFATEIAGVGSVGVNGGEIIRANNLKSLGFIEADNIQLEGIFEGKNKDFKNPLNPTEEELSHIRNFMKDSYDELVKAMVEGRGIDESALRNEMGAQIFMAGTGGLKYGLVDEIATRTETFEKIATELEIQDDFVVNTYKSFSEDSFDLFGGLFPPLFKRETRVVDPRASLCRENRILFYYGNIERDLCGRGK